MCLGVGRSEEFGSKILTQRGLGRPSGGLHVEQRHRFGSHDKTEGH